MDRLTLLDALWQKVDAFTAKVTGRYPNEITCRAGCSSCCKDGLGVTSVEADAIVELLGSLPPDARDELRQSALSPREGSCAALDADGRCGIYAARPLVCRSHGLPIRFREAETADSEPRRLPVLDACPLNFGSTPLESVSGDCVLDQSTLSTALLQIDSLARSDGSRAASGSERTPLADLLTGRQPKSGHE